MPLCIVEKNGRSAPVIICDVCLEPITDARDGNYEWISRTPGKSHVPCPLSFTHKKCSDEFERKNLDLIRQDALGSISNMELLCLPIYLGNNLNIDWKKAEQIAVDMSELIG